MSRIQKFNVNAGTLEDKVVLGPFQVPKGDQHVITDLAGTAQDDSEQSVLRIEKSKDNVVFKEIARLVMPDYGTYHRTWVTGIQVENERWWRVMGKQKVIGEFTVGVTGQAKKALTD